jgi:hypothetical protein
MHAESHPCTSTTASSLSRTYPSENCPRTEQVRARELQDGNQARWVEHEPSEEEKRIFGDWLLARWRLKDERLDRFYQSGVLDPSRPVTTFPLELSGWKDAAALFGGALPGVWLGWQTAVAFVSHLASGRFRFC